MKLSFSRKLLSIADKFMSSGNGASCRVEGLSNTDKVHLQRRLAERCRHRAEIVTVNYDELFTDSNCEERFEKDRVGLRSGDLICQTNCRSRIELRSWTIQNHPRVFFVFNAEHFISSLRQTLLYKLLNGTMLYPWLVVLAVNSQVMFSWKVAQAQNPTGLWKLRSFLSDCERYFHFPGFLRSPREASPFASVPRPHLRLSNYGYFYLPVSFLPTSFQGQISRDVQVSR